MKKFKLVTVVGTRPEIIRMSEIIKKFDKYFNHIIVNTNQNYSKELNKIFFSSLSIRKPDYNTIINTNSVASSVSSIIYQVYNILKKTKPDAFFTLGDTNSALSIYSAKRLKIPTFHFEAGNRCYDERVPEEINRRIIDHIADVNLTYSEPSKYNLIREGIDPSRIFKIGSPLYEVLSANESKIENSKILKKLKLNKNSYYLLSLHREENLELSDNFKILFKNLNNFSIKQKKKIIFSLHPRTLKNLKSKKIKLSKYFRFLKPLNFHDYIKLQKNAEITLSDSGSISEEAYMLKIKAINLRETHERHEAMENSAVPMCGIEDNFDKIVAFVKQKNLKIDNKLLDYLDENVSDKVVNIIISYINFVNKNVWKKN